MRNGLFFDLVLPRIVAGEILKKADIDTLGEGGLCLNCPVCTFPELRIWKVGECRCGNSYKKLKQLQPESKNIVLTGLTGEVLGEKALVSNGKLVWASVAGGFLEQHDQQIEQLEVNGIALVDGEKYLVKL